MPFILPELSFDKTALKGVISAETFDYHHGKHHKAYVDGTNRLVEEKGLEGLGLTRLILHARERGDAKLFNQAAQLWNHSFFWQCLAPPEGQRPSGKLKSLIEEAFGSTDQMLARFKEEALGHFSNGWAWLVLDAGSLRILSLHDADTPVAHEGMKPLFTVDLWEHAYYIDYRNARAEFLDKLLAEAVNWEFVAANLDGKGAARADQGD